MSWNVNDIPDQAGRTAVVTGANGGLGLETAKALAGAGAHVVMAARNQTKAITARDEILAAHPTADLEIVELDLASQESTRKAAAAIVAAHAKVDILVNNAGLMAMPERRTDDGFEMQLGVNHFGHWTFTAGLMPSLLAADAARVVTVTSVARHLGFAVDPDNVNLEDDYSAWPAYGRAKFANLCFAIGLDREFRVRDLPAASLAAHPGMSDTNLQAHTRQEGGGGILSSFFHTLSATAGMPAEAGALPQLRAATDPAAEGGQLYGPRFVTFGPPVRLPNVRPDVKRAAGTLWSVSEQVTGVGLGIDSALKTDRTDNVR